MKHMRAIVALIALGIVAGLAPRAEAAQLPVSSYSNDTGPDAWVSGIYLTALTDGVTYALVWGASAQETDKILGWNKKDMAVTFNFATEVEINEVVAWLGDSDGDAGVGLPSSITLSTSGGFTNNFTVTNPVGKGTTVPISMSGFTVTTDNITLTATRAWDWTVASEVQFFYNPPADPDLVTPDSVDLGYIDQNPGTTTGQITLENSGGTTLTISDVSFTGTDAAKFTVGTYPASLAAGTTGVVNFAFDSGGTLGRRYTATAEVITSDPYVTSVPVSVVVPNRYQSMVLDKAPLCYWSFEEPSGNAIELVSGATGNELVPIGGAHRSAGGTTTGGLSLGSAADFSDNVGCFRTTAGDQTVASQRWALEFWMYVDSATGYSKQYVINSGKSDSVPGNNPAVIFDFGQDSTDNELELFASRPPSPSSRTGDSTDGTVVLTVGMWHHIVAAFYGNNSGFADNLREIYVDGALVLSDTTSAFSAGWNGKYLYIGHLQNLFKGLIDEVALYELGSSGDSDGRDLAGDQAFVADIAAHYIYPPPPQGTIILVN